MCCDVAFSLRHNMYYVICLLRSDMMCCDVALLCLTGPMLSGFCKWQFRTVQSVVHSISIQCSAKLCKIAAAWSVQYCAASARSKMLLVSATLCSTVQPGQLKSVLSGRSSSRESAAAFPSDTGTAGTTHPVILWHIIHWHHWHHPLHPIIHRHHPLHPRAPLPQYSAPRTS